MKLFCKLLNLPIDENIAHEGNINPKKKNNRDHLLPFQTNFDKEPFTAKCKVIFQTSNNQAWIAYFNVIFKTKIHQL